MHADKECQFDLDDLPFEFRALELALELTCTSLDAQVWDYMHLLTTN